MYWKYISVNTLIKIFSSNNCKNISVLNNYFFKIHCQWLWGWGCFKPLESVTAGLACLYFICSH